MAIQIPRGTQDLLPGEIEKWQFVERKLIEVCQRYQYKEIRTPIFEHTELFLRGVGDSTDIVQKEVYTFTDRGGRSMTLRPEGTAAIVRSYVENKLYGNPDQPTKLFYMGPMFRYERPQAGRMRQFVQFGVEAIGSNDPSIDAEILALVMALYQGLGLKKLRLVVNSLGDKDSRNQHRNALIDYFKPRIGEFCEDCQRRLEQNPLRILDCKRDKDHELMESAPSILDYLNDYSKTYFETVISYLNDMNISYTIDPKLVRGLDYYNHTTFEVMSEAKGFGAITTLCGGGRYNGLAEDIGGPDSPGIGFALSIERLLMAIDAEEIEIPVENGIDCYLISLGEKAKEKSVSLLHQLRSSGIRAEKDYMDKKMKAQMKAADRLHVNYVAILGEDELEKGIVTVKDMATGEQQEVSIDGLADFIKGSNKGGN